MYYPLSEVRLAVSVSAQPRTIDTPPLFVQESDNSNATDFLLMKYQPQECLSGSKL